MKPTKKVCKVVSKETWKDVLETCKPEAKNPNITVACMPRGYYWSSFSYFLYTGYTNSFLLLWCEQMAGFLRLSHEEKQQTKRATSVIVTSHYTQPEWIYYEQYLWIWTMQRNTCGRILPNRFHSTPQSLKSVYYMVFIDSTVLILLDVILVLYQDKIIYFDFLIILYFYKYWQKYQFFIVGKIRS